VAQKRHVLLGILRERLIPVILERGFQQIAISDGSGELRSSFPFGYMRRLKGSDFELLEIQLDKHGGAKFVLNFGVVPPEGADVPWRHFEQTETRVSALPEWYRLHSCRGCMKWFSPSWLALSSDKTSRIARAVDRAIALYPEVENWFATRRVGSHMRRVGYPITARSRM
jgi:hypothetical protein